MLARCFSKPLKYRVIEGFGDRSFGRVRWEGKINQLLGILNRQGSQDQSIDQEKCSVASSQRQSKRDDRGHSHRGILTKHPETQTKITYKRVEPGQQLHIAAF